MFYLYFSVPKSREFQLRREGSDRKYWSSVPWLQILSPRGKQAEEKICQRCQRERQAEEEIRQRCQRDKEAEEQICQEDSDEQEDEPLLSNQGIKEKKSLVREIHVQCSPSRISIFNLSIFSGLGTIYLTSF